LAENVTDSSLPTTLDDPPNRYKGKRWPEARALVESGNGRASPSNFADQLKAETFATWNKVAESGWSALDKIKPLICYGDVELFRLKQRRDVFGQDHGSHFQGCKGGRWEEDSIAAHRLPQG
jgi:hypothetical protein